MSVRLFAKEYIQFGFLWLKKKILIILPKAFYALVHLKEPSVSLLPPSVEFILYKVSKFFVLLLLQMSLLLIRDNNQCQSSSVRNAILVWNLEVA